MNNPEAVLRAKKRELEEDIARRKGEARESDPDEVKDYSDQGTEDELSAETLEEAAMETRTLEEVEDALKRVADGTYGTCIECGKPIEPARLAAIPWTPYCLKHQKR